MRSGNWKLEADYGATVGLRSKIDDPAEVVGVAETLAEEEAGELPNPLLLDVGAETVGIGAEVTIG